MAILFICCSFILGNSLANATAKSFPKDNSLRFISIFSSEVAIALGASKLITLTDVGGVMKKLEDGSDYIIPVLDEKDVKDLVEEGIIKGGMIPKIEGTYY